jgi:hypothetical protein
MHYSKEPDNFMAEYTFAARLAILLGTDIAITIADSFIPHDLTPIRMIGAGVLLVFMAATMLTTARYVLEDF